MSYKSILLNGSWGMAYSRDKYTDTVCPQKEFYFVENAVPNYWEDMYDEFLYMPFLAELNVNATGSQKYPIAYTAPDMLLPNITGTFYYTKSFVYNENSGDNALHFDGVQNTVSVWINEIYIGNHEGYSTSFNINIPDGVLKTGNNIITLAVSNYRLTGVLGQPVSGLTSRATNEASGGITGNVEIRTYKTPLRDVNVLISEDCKTVYANITSTEKISCLWEVYDGEKLIKSGNGEEHICFSSDGLDCWSPETPKLYKLKISYENESVTTVFGVRRLTADGVHFKLNNKPYYLRGVCEHCYFPHTVHPEHNIAYYREIIKSIKKLGFNFIRFHTYVPFEEYMQACDELGVLIQIESPNNTSFEEWEKIVENCRKHCCVVIYCCGNELLLDEPFIEHLNNCADVVHKNTDSLFSPMSALRGVEYYWNETEHDNATLKIPFAYQPKRLEKIGSFSDLYNSYAQGLLSYTSLDADVEVIDGWSKLYNKPRLSHEICIDGTYTDLSLKDRYKNTKIGNSQMFSSIEKHLEEKGLLQKAPLFFKNSSMWQQRVRKYCFETIRRCENMAGFDFLGPIDTHWHTFGYDVGMMNEFYELKPGETIRNVLMYNSETVLLTDMGRNVNYESGKKATFNIYISCYSDIRQSDACLSLYLINNGRVIEREKVSIDGLKNGKVSKLYTWNVTMPICKEPLALKLYATFESGNVLSENEWEVYVFPNESITTEKNVIIVDKIDVEELEELMKKGKNVVLFGAEPFTSLPTSFRISLAGRTAGNLATCIYDHPLLADMPHDGFCGWQFNKMLENGSAICFENDNVPFEPIIEVASTHKFAIKQSILFEFEILKGKILVCGFNFDETDPGSMWFKSRIISYAGSKEFNPKINISFDTLRLLAGVKVAQTAENTNFAFNQNDITAIRKRVEEY